MTRSNLFGFHKDLVQCSLRTYLIAAFTHDPGATREASPFIEIIRDWMDGEMNLERKKTGVGAVR